MGRYRQNSWKSKSPYNHVSRANNKYLKCYRMWYMLFEYSIALNMQFISFSYLCKCKCIANDSHLNYIFIWSMSVEHKWSFLRRKICAKCYTNRKSKTQNESQTKSESDTEDEPKAENKRKQPKFQQKIPITDKLICTPVTVRICCIFPNKTKAFFFESHLFGRMSNIF